MGESAGSTRLSGRPTQRDVARLAGVSQATVSYVLTGRGGLLNDSTQARVRAALDALGYTPNVLARGLRGVRTALFGAIARDFRHPSIVAVIDALVRAARVVGYEMIVSTTEASAPDTLNLAMLMKEQLCDGVALVGDVPDESVLWDRYGEIALPAVGVLQGSRPLPVANVTVDNQAGATLALEHLLALGHSRIAFIGAGWIHGSRERRRVVEQFRAAGRLTGSAEFIIDTENTPEGGAHALETLWQLPEHPTALFAATDTVAIGVLARAAELGISVPQDLSVVGFDNIAHSAFLVPALTTVAQPFEAIAHQAIGLLVAGATTGMGTAEPHLIPPTLVTRSSTAAAQRN
ncbi:MAG: LacI family DNA-binding transcriptional regulator [Actinomycetota bacterium]|nr:LacI family DNA-binding transcriptional regulator [Actinomycetota bacterium]